MSNKLCKHCRFWNPMPGTSRLIADHLKNECQRRAPVIVPTQHETKGRWPITAGFDFCGEFEWVPELEPCRECGQPCGENPHRYRADYGPVCRACEAARPKFEDFSKTLQSGATQA